MVTDSWIELTVVCSSLGATGETPGSYESGRECEKSEICVTLICTRGYAQRSCIVKRRFNNAYQVFCVTSSRAFFFQVPHPPETR